MAIERISVLDTLISAAATYTAHTLVWCIAFVICLAITILIALKIDFYGIGEYFGVVLYIWICGLILSIIAAVVGNYYFDTGLNRGWNWALSIFLIAAVCSIAAAVVYGVREKWDEYGLSAALCGAIGLFLEAALMLGLVSFSADIDTGMAILDTVFVNVITSIFGSASMLTGLISIAIFPAFGVIAGLIISIFAHIRQRQKNKQAQIRARAEQQRAEERRVKEQKERAHEQWKNSINNQIDNLFK
jgi:hypothetical protein